MNIALIAHDPLKHTLADFCLRHHRILSKHQLFATGGTGDFILKKVAAHNTARERGEPTRHDINEHIHLAITSVPHGHDGGDIVIGAKVVSRDIDVVIFFRDPMTAHPHNADISALLRICDRHKRAIATNEATAEAIVYWLDS